MQTAAPQTETTTTESIAIIEPVSEIATTAPEPVEQPVAAEAVIAPTAIDEPLQQDAAIAQETVADEPIPATAQTELTPADAITQVQMALQPAEGLDETAPSLTVDHVESQQAERTTALAEPATSQPEPTGQEAVAQETAGEETEKAA